MNRRYFLTKFAIGAVSLTFVTTYYFRKKTTLTDVESKFESGEKLIEMPFDLILVNGYFVPKNSTLGAPRTALKALLNVNG